MKQIIANYIKNIGGWTTKRKILCFAVDDYGNVRIKDKASLENMKAEGFIPESRFDKLDALDTKEDFQQLFEVLGSVEDQNHNPAIFTTYALSANIDFKKILQEPNHYQYELLPETYKRLSSEDKCYDGAWELLKKGIDSRLIKPQFHGREHLNVLLFESYLQDKHPVLFRNLENHCYTGIPESAKLPTIQFSQAFAFWEESEIEKHKNIIKSGLSCFKEVYGYDSVTFTPPAQQLHPNLYPFLENLGIQSIDKPRKIKRHLGKYKYVEESNKLGFQDNESHITIVRNVLFEPNQSQIHQYKISNWVDFTFKQIKAAFIMHKPAIVSSHRVNFCGHINQQNRTESLRQLKALLKKVVEKYPDVEFMAVNELVNEITKTTPSKS